MGESEGEQLEELLKLHNLEQDENKNEPGAAAGNNNNNNNNNDGILRDIKFTVDYSGPETLRRRFNGNDTIGTLRQAIADQVTGGIVEEEAPFDFTGKKKLLRLIYLGKNLDNLDAKISTLKQIKGNGDYNHTIMVAFNVIGGSNNTNNDEKKDNNNTKRKRLAHFRKEKRIKPTLEPDCIFNYNEKKLRVKMPCGHSFDSNTIFCIAKMNIENLTKSVIKCPMLKCKTIWDFDVVAAGGDFSEIEYANFSSILSKRALLHSGNYRECKGCKTLVSKPDILNYIRVHCKHPKCKRGDFCWVCGQDWIGGGFKVCGNKNCSTITINNFLQTCETVKLGGIECPQLRVCPRCLTLVGWAKKCKHMKCSKCNKEFCFICLGLKDDTKGWQCGGNCSVAPRQSLK